MKHRPCIEMREAARSAPVRLLLGLHLWLLSRYFVTGLFSLSLHALLQGTNTIILLETLKRAVDSSGHSAPSSPLSIHSGNPFSSSGPDLGTPGAGPGGSQTPGLHQTLPGDGYPTPASLMSQRTLEDEDSLLLDSTVSFLPARAPCCAQQQCSCQQRKSSCNLEALSFDVNLSTHRTPCLGRLSHT